MAKLPDRLFLIWSRSTGKYGKLCTILTERGWTVSIVQHAASLEYVIALVALSANEQDDSQLASNINELTQRLYGVEFQEDCVIRPNPYKLYHPKEAMLEDFVANRGLAEVLKQHTEHKPSEDHLSRPQDGPIQFGPRILYPQGCTLKVQKRQLLGDSDKKLPPSSTIMMTTSRWALPGEQPICTFLQANDFGKTILFGSSRLLSDRYLDLEDNRSLVECFIDFLSSTPDRPFPINISDARTIEIAESNMTADFSKLTQEPIGCLRQLDPLPEKRTQLIDLTLFGLDSGKLPLVIDAYRELDIDYQPLTLMKPRIEWPGIENWKSSSRGYLLCTKRGD